MINIQIDVCLKIVDSYLDINENWALCKIPLTKVLIEHDKIVIKTGIGYYFIEHCGLHWRTNWPLMNPLNNIPFWGPGAMYNSLVRFNLKKNEKNYIFEVSKLLEAKPRTFSFFSLETYQKMVPSIKKFFWSEAPLKRYENFLANF